MPSAVSSPAKSRPVISTLPSSVNCRRRTFLGDEFEAGPVKMVCFEAALRRRGLAKQDLEDVPGNAHHTLIVADTDAEFDNGALRVPMCVRWETEKHAPPRSVLLLF
jgi:hypothetical protein